jgi:hypothetical protein
MKKILIVALYKKEQLKPNLFVGIFLNDLAGPPLESVALRPARDDIVAECDIAAKLHALIQDYRHKIEVSFSEEIKILIDKDNCKKTFFVKPEDNFDYSIVLKQLKI